MPINSDRVRELEKFFSLGGFDTRGAVITDLDGTVVHEFKGRTVIHKSVEIPLKKLYQLGRPVIINTLRFPLSVIGTFGKDWYGIAGAPIPVILLNGSQLGYITQNYDEFVFEQLHSETLTSEETNGVVKSVERFIKAGILDFILFYYPEDWKEGEIIWTPVKEKIPHLQKKYKSASAVISTGTDILLHKLTKQPICMIFLLIEAPDDQLMAYQHTRKNNFITHSGIDKAWGTRKMAELLDFDLNASIGAGDSEMDVFLKETGLAISIGKNQLPFKGKKLTMHMRDYPDLGELFEKLASLQRSTVTSS